MAIFTVHTPATRAGEAASADKIVFLRDGFSAWALLFGPFWLAWNRAFIAAIVWAILLGAIGFGLAKLGASEEAMSLVSLAFGVALGFEGRHLIAWTLARRGYKETGLVSGEDLEEVEETYFRDWRPQTIASPPPPASLPSVSPPPAGLGEETGA